MKTGNLKELSEAIFSYIDEILMANYRNKKLDKISHNFKSLTNFLLSGNPDDFIKIVEYENG